MKKRIVVRYFIEGMIVAIEMSAENVAVPVGKAFTCFTDSKTGEKLIVPTHKIVDIRLHNE